MTDPKRVSDELLQRYFDDELSAAESAEVEARLDGDARLRLEALGELRTLLRVSSSAEPRVDFSSTLAAIERGGAPVTPLAAAPRKRRAWLPMSAVGGFLAAAAAIAFLMMPTRDLPPNRDLPPSNEAEVETLEVQGALATVFRVPDGPDPARTTTVIWAALDEDDASALKPGAVPAPAGVEIE